MIVSDPGCVGVNVADHPLASPFSSAGAGLPAPVADHFTFGSAQLFRTTFAVTVLPTSTLIGLADSSTLGVGGGGGEDAGNTLIVKLTIPSDGTSVVPLSDVTVQKNVLEAASVPSMLAAPGTSFRLSVAPFCSSMMPSGPDQL